MLRKELRLNGPISRKAKNFSTPEFSIKYYENGETVSRFAFVVSKKIDKRAVVRNRIKRVLRNCVEENLNEIKKGYDILFLLKKELVDKDRKDVENFLINALRQNKLYV